jgi:hypothetical protein
MVHFLLKIVVRSEAKNAITDPADELATATRGRLVEGDGVLLRVPGPATDGFSPKLMLGSSVIIAIKRPAQPS